MQTDNFSNSGKPMSKIVTHEANKGLSCFSIGAIKYFFTILSHYQTQIRRKLVLSTYGVLR